MATKSGTPKKRATKVRDLRSLRSKSLPLTIPQVLLEGDSTPFPMPPKPRPVVVAAPETPAVAPSVPKAEPQVAVAPAPAIQVPPPPMQAPPTPEPPPPPVTEAKAQAPAAQPAALPDAYGSKKLLLVPRDPHWLYAHWDLTRSQLAEYNRQSSSGHLVLRMHREGHAGPPEEIDVHPESRNWFVQVREPGRTCHAELGYYSQGGGPWVSVSSSEPVTPPSGGFSANTTFEFRPVASDQSLQYLVKLARSALSDKGELLTVLEDVRETGTTRSPEGATVSIERRWTPEQQRAMAEIVMLEEARRISLSSLEVAEILRKQMSIEVTPQPVQPNLWSGAIPNISSPVAGPQQKSFWFNVNAELVVYGATEPGAQVSIGGRPIRLRPDGTFTFRFALPDGEYMLPTQAVSADGTDTRRAALQFIRQTTYEGDVGTHPQAADLKEPKAENVIVAMNACRPTPQGGGLA